VVKEEKDEEEEEEVKEVEVVEEEVEVEEEEEEDTWVGICSFSLFNSLYHESSSTSDTKELLIYLSNVSTRHFGTA
jgi:hypothetical protein